MTEQPELPPVVRTPEGIIPLDQLHYDADLGLHRLSDCDTVHGTADRHDAAAAGAALRRRAELLAVVETAREDAETRALAPLSDIELLEDMLAHLREVARRVRHRHYQACSTLYDVQLDRATLELEARIVRTTASVLIGAYPPPPGPAMDDFRERLAAYRKDAMAEEGIGQ